MNYVTMWFKIFYSNFSTASILSYNWKLRNFFSSQNLPEKDFGLPLCLAHLSPLQVFLFTT
jgi:hypothetical protein